MFQPAFVDPSYGSVIILFVAILQSLHYQLLVMWFLLLDVTDHLLGAICFIAGVPWMAYSSATSSTWQCDHRET